MWFSSSLIYNKSVSMFMSESISNFYLYMYGICEFQETRRAHTALFGTDLDDFSMMNPGMPGN